MEIDSSSNSSTTYHSHFDHGSLGKGFGMENARSNISHEMYKFDVENAPVPKDLNELCQILHKIFDRDTVNVEYVKRIIENYKSNPKDWRKYAKYDPHK